MPIEINEVHVRVTVGEAGPGSASAPAAPAQAAGTPSIALLEQSIEQMLEILRDKNER